MHILPGRKPWQYASLIYFYLLIMSTLKSSVKSVDYMEEFVKRYPEIYRNRTSQYYAGKCGIVITLFIEMCIQEFGLKSVTRVRGTRRDWTRKYGPNACHVVCQIEDMVYDPTYAQISAIVRPGQPLIYHWVEPYAKWNGFYDKVEKKEWTIRDCREYKKWWTAGLVDVSKRSPDTPKEEIQHYEDLHKHGYI